MRICETHAHNLYSLYASNGLTIIITGRQSNVDARPAYVLARYIVSILQRVMINEGISLLAQHQP